MMLVAQDIFTPCERQAELGLEDFEEIFGESPGTLFPECRQLIEDLDFRYDVLQGIARENVFLRVLKTLNQNLEVAGKHRKSRWEAGWGENLHDFQSTEYDLAALAPKFVRLQEIIRLQGEYIRPFSHQFESNFVKVLRHWMFKKWFHAVDHIYEFGCGTGHNLIDAAALFPNRSLYGLDWSQASQSILHLLKEHHGMNVVGREFDMLEPDENVYSFTSEWSVHGRCDGATWNSVWKFLEISSSAETRDMCPCRNPL